MSTETYSGVFEDLSESPYPVEFHIVVERGPRLETSIVSEYGVDSNDRLAAPEVLNIIIDLVADYKSADSRITSLKTGEDAVDLDEFIGIK